MNNILYSSCQGHIIALAPGGKNPIDQNWTTAPPKINGDASAYLDLGYNLGYRLTERDLIIDIDPRNGGDVSFLALPAEIQGLPATTETASGGQHIYTTLPKGVDYKTLRSSLREYPGIDFLHKGKQVVIPGSSLPDGRTWTLAPSAQFPAPTAPPQLIELLLRETKPHSEAIPSGYLTGLELHGLLDTIPVASYRDNDSWLKLTMACHHATDGEGLEAFLAWSLSDDMYSDQEQIIRTRWESMGSSQQSAPITIRTLIRELAKHGAAPTWLLIRAGLTDSAASFFDSAESNTLQARYAELEALVENETQQVKLLTSVAVTVAADSTINEGMREILLKRIAKKTGTSLSAIKKDLRLLSASRASAEPNPEVTNDAPLVVQAVDQSQVHTQAAQATIAVLQGESDDITPMFCMDSWWRWNGSFWDGETSHADIRRRVLQVLIGQGVQATASAVNAVADLMQVMLEVPSWKLQRSVSALRAYTPYKVLEYEPALSCFVEKDHSYAHHNTSVINTVYDPSAPEPKRWLQFLGETMTSKQAQRTLGAAIAYTVIGARPWLRKAFYLYGPHRSGKSTALDAIQAVIGAHNVSSLNISQIGSKNGSAELVGKLANISNETISKKTIQDDTFKALVSGEAIMAERKFKNPFQFFNTSKLFFAANGFPRILDDSGAVWDRLVILSFPHTFTIEQADHNLGDALKQERSGILNWALQIFAEEYAKDECRSVMDMDPAGKAVMEQWQTMNNPPLQWVKERTEGTPEGKLSVGAMYTDYKLWCKLTGHYECAINQFSRVIGKVLTRSKDTDGKTVYLGVKLRPFDGGE